MNQTPAITVVTRSRRFVRLLIDGKPYRLNRYGILCRVSTLPDGREWFSYSDLTREIDTDILHRFSISHDYTGGEVVHQYA